MSAFAVPASTNTKAPPVISAASSPSGVLVNTYAVDPSPTVVTLYKPFSVASV